MAGTRTAHVLAAALGMALLSGCASSKAQRRPYLIAENLDNATRQLAQGHTDEAAEICHAVLLAEPGNPQAQDLLQGIGPYEPVLTRPSALGANLCRRRPGGPMALRIAAYPVSRALDLLDVVSFHVGLESGIYLDAHTTRAISAELGASGGVQVGWWQPRELAVGTAHVAGAAVGPFEAHAEGFARAGTRGARNRSFSVVEMNQPTDYPYQYYRDYWGIGTRLTVLLVGVSVEVHPLELADGIAGLFLLDFLHDDIGHTRAWRLTGADHEAMADLVGTLTPAELRASMRGRKLPPAPPSPAVREETPAQ